MLFWWQKNLKIWLSMLDHGILGGSACSKQASELCVEITFTNTNILTIFENQVISSLWLSLLYFTKQFHGQKNNIWIYSHNTPPFSSSVHNHGNRNESIKKKEWPSMAPLHFFKIFKNKLYAISEHPVESSIHNAKLHRVYFHLFGNVVKPPIIIAMIFY